MKWKGITIEQLAADSEVSLATIDRIRNDKQYIPRKDTLFKLCIGMHLEYELSIDLFHKAGYLLKGSSRELWMDYLMRTQYQTDIEACIKLLNKLSSDKLLK